jgi:RNA polymerase sigma-70 factor (ECF subfamily)
VPLELEASLIDGARSGGANLEQLIRAVWPEAYRIAFSMLRDRGLAEDAAQEACAAIARSLPSLKKTDGFSAWSYRIIVNHAIVAARRRQRAQSLDELPAAAGAADRSEALDLHDALMKLPVEQRGAIVLHYYVGLNSREIAASTGLPPSTVRFHLMLARRTLHKALSAVPEPNALPSEEVLSNVR